MDNRTWVQFVVGVASAGAMAAIAVSCLDQPRTKCQTGRGIFAAKYTPVSVSAEDGGCLLKGEQLGIQPYNPANSDNTAPDIERGSVAMRGGQVAAALANHDPDTEPGHNPYALGNFLAVLPGGDDFCDVPTMEPSVQEFSAVDEVDAGPDGGGGKPAVPAVSLKYDWKNVRFYVTAAQAGVQMKGDLTFTKNGCTAEYKVNAVYPTTDCFVQDDAGVKHAAPEKCLPPDLEKGRQGSAINVDVATVCDPDLFLCVLAKDPPSGN